MTANRRGSTPSRTSVVRGPNAKPGEGWIPREAHRTTGGPTQEDILRYLHRGDPVTDSSPGELQVRPAADVSVQNTDAGESPSEPEVITGRVVDLDALAESIRSAGVVIEGKTRSEETTHKTVEHTWRAYPMAAPPAVGTVGPVFPEAPKTPLTVKQQSLQETPEQALERKLAQIPPKYEYSLSKILPPAIGAATTLVLMILLLRWFVDIHASWWVWVLTIVVGCAGTVFLIVRAKNAPLEEVPNPSREWLLRQHESNPRYWS